MVDILDIGSEPIFDDQIVKIETHTYNPYVNATFGHNDEIRIPIQQQDLYTLPCESFLYIESKFTQSDNHALETLINNCAAFLFDEIRYELDGVEIDRCKNLGVTSMLKHYISLTRKKNMMLNNVSWNLARNMIKEYFNYCIPLNTLLGFCEDYNRIVINARHELILIHSRTDYNCVLGHAASDPKIELFKIQWRMPHVILKDVNKLSMLRALESGRYLSMSFRSWNLYEYPFLQSTTKHSWAVKTAIQPEKPRYVIFALQTGQKNTPTGNITMFHDCKLTNMKLYLNSDFYPYDDMNSDFGGSTRTPINYYSRRAR